jgi:hypothetical protein
MKWDWIISVAIIFSLILVIWAKVAHQTIPELLRDLKDLFTESKDEISERGQGVVIYE